MAEDCPHCDSPLSNGFCEPCDILINCCFPDCGCDGNRLCDAENGASERAFSENVEGMWSGKTHEQRRAVASLVGSVLQQRSGDTDSTANAAIETTEVAIAKAEKVEVEK